MSNLDTRENLLKIALELIWQSNYNSVGVNEICSQSGVTKGAFYHHFDSKASLFCEATVYYWQVIKCDLDNIFSIENSPIQQLENFIQFLFISKFGNTSKKVPGCPFYYAGAQIGTDNIEVLEALRTMWKRADSYNLTLAKGLQAGGYLERQDDVAQLARLMHQYIHGLMSYVRISNDIEQAKSDLPAGLYRILSLKPEFWFSTKSNWEPKIKIL